MALQKQPVSINFQRGLDTKSDPYQVQVGNFLSLNNTVFTTAGRLTKRNGYANITDLPNTNESILTTLNDNLIATGSNIYSYVPDINQWVNKGMVQPIQLSTQPLVRVGTSQTSPDAAIAPNGLCCLAYMDNSVSYYQISDSTTGEQVVSRTALPSTAINPRTFVLGNFFIVTFMINTPALEYIAIPISNPFSPRAATLIGSSVTSQGIGYDGIVANNTLYVSWGSTSTSIKTSSISAGLTITGTVTILTTVNSTFVSLAADLVRNMIFVSYGPSSTIHTAAYNFNLAVTMANTVALSSGLSLTFNNLTSVARNGICTVFAQVTNNYSYVSSLSGDNIRSDYIESNTVTLPVSGVGTGTAGTPKVVLRSVGLASKAFFGPSNTIYLLSEYGCLTNTSSLDNSNEPSYFLIDSNGNIYMRLSYENAGGYAANIVLPSVSQRDGAYLLSYLTNDFIATVNKGTNLATGTQINAIYTQTGINLAEFTFNTQTQYSSEIAGALHLTGGQLWEYDGVRPVEHGFHVWPENVAATFDATDNSGALSAGTYFYQFTYEWTDNAGNLHRSAPSIPVSFTIDSAPTSFTASENSDTTLSSISSFTGLQVGQVLSGTGIQAGTRIVALSPGISQITISLATTTTGSHTISVASINELSISVPTLRLTYKLPPNPVRIVGYRWSSNQQVYYQFTSLTSPTLNDVTVDQVTINDTLSDAQILGNNIIYTTGGVIENIAAPASIASALFNNRLFLIDAEDQNLLWYSKQVIENTPIEMSDLLTLYVAPTTGVQGSTGPMTALGAMDDKLIVFKKDAIYYINGQGPDNTGANNGFSDPVYITSAVGSANPNSIVLIPNGLMFQSDKGIWLLGRDLSTNYIGSPVEIYNSNIVKSANAVPATTQVRFVLDNNITLMYDYFFNQWATHSNKDAISATLYQGSHTYLNNLGQIYQETPNTWLDGSTPVLISLTTSWINIAGLQGYERFYFANLLGTYYTPFTLNCTLAYDYNPSALQAVEVLPRNYVSNWGGENNWGSGGPWGGPGNVFSARMFPNKQKCQSFQVSINEVYDPSFGQAAGQGLTLSGLALIVGVKKGYRTQSAAKSFGST